MLGFILGLLHSLLCLQDGNGDGRLFGLGQSVIDDILDDLTGLHLGLGLDDLGIGGLPSVTLARAGILADGLASEGTQTLGNHFLDIGGRELGLGRRLHVGRLGDLGGGLLHVRVRFGVLGIHVCVLFVVSVVVKLC